MSKLQLESLKLYFTEYCVQGERIPFYILWDNSNKIKISINLPKGLTLEEMYNVNSNDMNFENNIHVVNDFEMNGYLGGVLGSKIYEDASSIKTIKFSIHFDSNETQTFEKKIELFRPDVHVDDNIGVITIKNDKNNRAFSDDGITIFNRGKGTAIIRVNLLANSEIKEGHPEGFEEFKKKFEKDLFQVFTDVGKKFSQYETLLESLIEVCKNPLPTEKEKFKQVQKTVNELENAFNNNEEFLTELLQGIGQAYFKNVSIMTDADAFLAFLKSVGANKLIFLDAMKILKVSPDSRTLNAELILTDLAQNEYQPIKLRPITFKADKEFSLPLYQIIRLAKEG